MQVTDVNGRLKIDEKTNAEDEETANLIASAEYIFNNVDEFIVEEEYAMAA